MSTLAINSSASLEDGYLKNVGRAARALLAALLAVPLRRADSEARSRRQLQLLANSYEALTPNLSAELRFLASRG